MRSLTLSTLSALLAASNLEASSESIPADDSHLNWSFAYDELGRVTARFLLGDQVVRYSYADQASQVTRHDPDGEEVVWSLNERGQISRRTDRLGVASYTWDAFERLATISSSHSRPISFEYDSKGRVKALQAGEGYRVEYSFDYLGRLNGIKTPVGDVRYDYQSGSRTLIRTLPNQVASRWTYAPDGALEKIVHTDRKNYIISAFSYRQDLDSRIVEIGERSPWFQGSHRFDYDAIGQLTGAVDSLGQSWSYRYNKFGARVSAESTLGGRLDIANDWAGRAIKINEAPSQSDPAGNLSAFKSDGLSRHFKYNVDGQLVEARLGESIVRYQYDGDGFLSARESNGNRITFTNDPTAAYWKPLVMEESNGRSTFIVWEGSSPLMMIRDNDVEYLIHDHLGSTRVVLGASGKPLHHQSYSPFGKPIGDASPEVIAPSFAGLFRDRETNMILTLARTYSPELGRFLQPNPVKRLPRGSARDLSLFDYGGGDPVNYISRNGVASSAFSNVGGITQTGRAFAVPGMSLAAQPVQATLPKPSPPMTLAVENQATLPPKSPVNILISGRGIEQYDDISKIESGHVTALGTFKPALSAYDRHEVYKLPPKDSKHKDYYKTDQEVADEVYEILRRNLTPQGSLRPGQTFELRTAHDVNLIDYLRGGEPQERAQRNTVAVLQGVENFKRDFGLKKNQPITVGVQAGSNDGMAYTHAINQMSDRHLKPVDFLVLDDPQAKISNINKVIKKLGAENVSIFNPTKGLGDSIRGEGEIASWSKNAQILAEANPGLRFFQYKAKDGIIPRVNSHIQASIAPRTIDDFRLYDSKTKTWEFSKKAAFGQYIDAHFVSINAQSSPAFANMPMKKHRTNVQSFWDRTIDDVKSVSNANWRKEFRNAFAQGIAQDVTFAKEFWSGVFNPPLTQGSERLDVLNEITDLALRLEGGHILGARNRAIRWRYGDESYPGKSVPTYAELATAENALTAGNLAEATGKTIAEIGIEGWRRLKFSSEKLGYVSSQMKIPGIELGGSYWQPTTDIGLRMQHEWKRKYSRSIVQRIDDFLVPPAYGDEIPMQAGMSSPSPVGGVALSGSASLIEGIGEIEGFHLGINGNLTFLFSDAEKAVELPPFRIDDLVTIFRSVYLNGEGPSVTIDPDPNGPMSNPMLIIHSEATDATYVGWVLYQVDRIMKTYMLGVDNQTREECVSGIPSYQDILDKVYFSGSENDESWERFWIVPSAIRKYTGDIENLTLFGLPLQVETQKMKWVNGKLVDDPTGVSSEGANAFSKWFTENYDVIAEEQYLMPPIETGISKPVPVFKELRRFAALTAVAESMRDQGLPLPFWMRQHAVRPIPFEDVTRGIEVSKEKRFQQKLVQAKIFGGVSLTPESARIRTIDAKDDKPRTFEDRKTEAEYASVGAKIETLETAQSQLEAATASPLKPIDIVSGGASFQAMSVPGFSTKALNPCQLETVDLSIPLSNGREMKIARRYHSFFDPSGEFGRGWTMNQPRLQMIKMPTSKKRTSVQFHYLYELWTPHNSSYARFDEVQALSEMGGSKLRVPKGKGPYLGLANDHPDFLGGTATDLVILKNGNRWHFKNGFLAAIEEPGVTIVYHRDDQGHILRQSGLLNGALDAEIAFHYDKENRIETIRATIVQGRRIDNGSVFEYAYNNDGRLISGTSKDERFDYRYNGRLLAEHSTSRKSRDGSPQVSPFKQSFSYNGRGQLVATRSGGLKISNDIVVDANGHTYLDTTIEQSSSQGKPILARSSDAYDASFRPLESFRPDGTLLKWNYPEEGGSELRILDASTAFETSDAFQKTSDLTSSSFKQVALVRVSPDGKRRDLEHDSLPTISARFDTSGRLVAIADGGEDRLRQTWHENGLIATVADDSTTTAFQYGSEGQLASTLVHPSSQSVRLTEWTQTAYDKRLNPVSIKDATGLNIAMD